MRNINPMIQFMDKTHVENIFKSTTGVFVQHAPINRKLEVLPTEDWYFKYG